MRTAGIKRCSLLPYDRKTLVEVAAAAAAIGPAVDSKMTCYGGSGGPVVVDLDDDDDVALEVVPTTPAKSAAWTENLLIYLENKFANVSKLEDDDEPPLVTPVKIPDANNNNNKNAHDVVIIDDSSDGSYSEIDEEDDDVEVVSDSSMDAEFSSVLQKLGSMSAEQVKKLIESASERLRSSLVNLKMMKMENQASQMAAGLAAACSALSTGNLKVEKEQNNLLRLLVQIKKRHPSIFTPEQIKQLNDIGRAVISENVNVEKQFTEERECNLNLVEGKNRTLHNPVCSSSGNSSSDNGGQSTQQGTSRSVDPQIPVESLRAISSYHEKYGQNLLSSNHLPTPTPSEEFKDNDKHGREECSKSAESSRKRSASTFEGVGSAKETSCKDGHEKVTGVTVGFKKKAKNRDPRLRFRSEMEKINRSETFSELGNSNSSKPKINDKLTQGGSSLEKQNNGSRDTKNVSPQPCKRVDPIQNAKMETKTFLNGDSTSVRRPGENINCKNVVRAEQISGQVTALNAHEGQPSIQNAKMDTKKLVDNSNQQAGVDVNSDDVGRVKQKPGQVAASNAHSRQQFVATKTQKDKDHERNSVEETQLAAETSTMITLNDVQKAHGKNRDPCHISRQNVAKERRNLVSKKIKLNGHPVDTQNGQDILAVGEHGKSSKNNLPADFVLCSQLKSASDHEIQSQMTNLPTVPSASLKISEPTSCESQVNILPAVPSLNISEPTSSESEKNPLDSLSCLNGRRGVPDSCGKGLDASISSDLWGDVNKLLDGFDEQQKAAIRKERARRIEEQNEMFNDRKLCLVLDLDHTLLNSVNFDHLVPAHEEMLRRRVQEDKQKPERHLFHLPHMRLWTKLRPGIWNFLEKASKLYKLHVSTMGTRSYANEMTKLLDPNGVLFAERVMSRGDDNDIVDKIKDLDGVLGMESAVVIIDDTAKVWAHHIPNLINVERYMYFPSSRRQFGLPGPSLFEIDRDEREADGTLASALMVIQRIHKIFFSHKSLHEVDVRKILANEQRRVLAGCKILFSRVIPVGTSNPHLHPLWQLAEQFGALCTNQMDEQVTHVVATSSGTDKVNWALTTDRFVVRPSWIEASAFLYRRAKEKHFALKTKTKAGSSPV